MSGQFGTLEFKIRLSFPLCLGFAVVLHLILFILGPLKLPGAMMVKSNSAANSKAAQNRGAIPVKFIRTMGHKDGSKLNNTYLSSTKSDSKKISPKVSSPGIPTASMAGVQQIKKGSGKGKVDLRDLSAAPQRVFQNKINNKTQQTVQVPKSTRPGTMPVVAAPKKAIEAISLSGSGIKEFAESGGSRGQSNKNYNVSGGQNISSFQNTDVGVNLEVPEGVSPDELNEYEMMYYSFQKRVAVSYVNSFMSHYNKFERMNPHLKFPMTEGKETMTGRLTYDSEGNIKQIKMVRWTNVGKLQDFFLEVVKGMESIQNPPKTLWEKDGEFTVFFTLVVNPQG